MSTGDVAAIVGGTDYAVTIAAGAFLANRLIDRLRVTGQQQRIVSVPVAGREPPSLALPPDAPGRLPATKAVVQERQQQFDGHREAGLSVKEAGLAVGVKDTTARDYEKARLARAGAA